MKKPELLAPGGSLEKLKTAIDYGADAVYLAGTSFGMRSFAGNFTADELPEAVCFAHDHGVRVHVTVNTMPRNDEVARLPEHLERLNDAGVDALILADLGAFTLAGKYAPKCERHISTQQSIANYECARAWYDLGAKRVVLAREVSLQEIREMRAKIPEELEVETFCHGAMCVSYSGRCLLSNYMTGRDSNRGQCAQPCRWKYGLTEAKRPGQVFDITEDEQGTYIFNSRDMCMIEHLPALLDAGITSLKIEGRTKSAYYVGAVTNAYRHALDDAIAGRPLDPVWQREVLQISHRPYSTGFYFGEPGQYTANSAYFAGAEVCAVVEGTAPDGRAVLTQRNKFCAGDTLELITNDAPPVTFTAEALRDADGLPLETVPHPMQRFTMPLPCAAAPLSLIRRKLPAETVDIRLECGKI
mgnify:CR=1 FL=1